jgi:hypothetical protein
METTSDALRWLAMSSVYGLILTAVSSIAASFVIQMLLDTGLRRAYHSSWIRNWLEARHEGKATPLALVDILLGPVLLRGRSRPADVSDAWRRIHESPLSLSLPALTHSQLCAQVSALARLDLDENRQNGLVRILSDEHIRRGDEPPYASTNDRTTQGAYERLERSVDALQIYLGQRWRLFDQSLAAIIAIVLITSLLSAAPQTVPASTIPVVIGIAIATALAVPSVRPFVERLARGRY